MAAQSYVTVWTVRAACVLYAFALGLWLMRKPRFFRLLWTLGCASYLGHVIAAFAFHYNWSHQAAYAGTARQTAAWFGVRWGGGLYFNYFFTVLWTADVLWMWRGGAGYSRRSRWTGVVIHAFMAFMFFNATVVFASGWVRWLGLAALSLLAMLWAGAGARQRWRGLLDFRK